MPPAAPKTATLCGFVLHTIVAVDLLELLVLQLYCRRAVDPANLQLVGPEMLLTTCCEDLPTGWLTDAGHGSLVEPLTMCIAVCAMVST